MKETLLNRRCQLSLVGVLLLAGCQAPDPNPRVAAGSGPQYSAQILADRVMQDFEIAIGVIKHNLANANTPGYKRTLVLFQEAPSPPREVAISDPMKWNRDPAARLAELPRDLSQGDLQQTGRRLDFAIVGDGFFTVQLPDGSLAYTRAGSFQLAADGRWVTGEGYPLQGGFQPTPGEAGLRITVTTEGVVSYSHDKGGSTYQAQLCRFPDPERLESIGENLFRETVRSGSPLPGTPGKNGLGTLNQGYYERSNVDPGRERSLLEQIQRAREAYARALEIERSVKGNR